jgi:uncharacterized membrane protein
MSADRLQFNTIGRWLGPALAGAVLAAAIIPLWPYITARAAEASIQAPDWGLWRELSPVIKLHIFAAVAALLIGTVILLRPKGRGLHKALGWSWVAAMGTTAVSSLFITGLNGGFYSFVHLLSGWTIVALPMAIFAIRKRNVVAHRRAMTGMFVGGLIVAGALSFLPGRFMFEFFFG